MECKFITNGLAVSYDQVIKPCCVWQYNNNWADNNHINNTSLINWHNKTDVLKQKQLIDQNIWPDYCLSCNNIESQNRQDSMRGNGNHAYQHYTSNDIALEIRPGNVCNFACQTCWPEASSRVAQYHHQAGLIDIRNLNSNQIDNFDFLLPIKDRIKDVVLLGGEPFYDKSSKRFIQWAQENLSANLTIFTNGSTVDFDFVNKYQGTLKLVFSLDAYGLPAEYIRYGTIWDEVKNNFLQAKNYKNVDLRVNVTCSVYNYHHLKELIVFLCKDWPTAVTFGQPKETYFKEGIVPLEFRPDIIASLNETLVSIVGTKIESDQKTNALRAIKSIITNLSTLPWDPDALTQWQQFTSNMDRLKHIHAHDYCKFLGKLLKYKIC